MADAMRNNIVTWCKAFGMLVEPSQVDEGSGLRWAVQIRQHPDSLFMVIAEHDSAWYTVNSRLSAHADHLALMRYAGDRVRRLFLSDLLTHLNMLPIETMVQQSESDIDVMIMTQLFDSFGKQDMYRAVTAINRGLIVINSMFERIQLRGGDWR